MNCRPIQHFTSSVELHYAGSEMHLCIQNSASASTIIQWHYHLWFHS